jgi:hypothetical protein
MVRLSNGKLEKALATILIGQNAGEKMQENIQLQTLKRPSPEFYF